MQLLCVCFYTVHCHLVGEKKQKNGVIAHFPIFNCKTYSLNNVWLTFKANRGCEWGVKMKEKHKQESWNGERDDDILKMMYFHLFSPCNDIFNQSLAYNIRVFPHRTRVIWTMKKGKHQTHSKVVQWKRYALACLSLCCCTRSGQQKTHRIRFFTCSHPTFLSENL